MASDPTGEVLWFSGSKANLEKMKKFVNEHLHGVKLEIDKFGKASLVSTNERGTPTPEQEALEKTLAFAINRTEAIKMEVVTNNPNVLFGDYLGSRIDIGDIEQVGDSGPPTGAAVFAHEVAEQTAKQVFQLGNTRHDFVWAHSYALSAQALVEGRPLEYQGKAMLGGTGVTTSHYPGGGNTGNTTVYIIWINGNLRKIIRR